MARTVKIRAAVAVDPKTKAYGVSGYHDGECSPGDADILESMKFGGTTHPGDQITWITAEIPIREPETVEAEVETNDRS